ncbi:ATP-binding protein [Cryobacterium sp. SO1]|uniref:ATP-binding protein n=1 Tax=Cryobacterium sp. SO1 TaxID=1897061 RepID=UPI0010D05C0C|nr:ATP-binding protein [Cryobacterium sp. SO1]RZI36836.1 Insertion sequence putative ATP-binding protein [Cryobacterium sp. SO1]
MPDRTTSIVDRVPTRSHYTRISTSSQDAQLQLDALVSDGVQERRRTLPRRDRCGDWAAGRDKPGGKEKFLRKYAAFTLLVIDEWLLDQPDDNTRSMLLELLERRYDTTSTVFCTQYAKKDWHQRLGSGVHADAIMDRIVHRTIWIETGGTNMREHTADNAA